MAQSRQGFCSSVLTVERYIRMLLGALSQRMTYSQMAYRLNSSAVRGRKWISMSSANCLKAFACDVRVRQVRGGPIIGHNMFHVLMEKFHQT